MSDMTREHVERVADKVLPLCPYWPELAPTCTCAACNAERTLRALNERQNKPESFGDPNGPPWQRGTIYAPEANERLVEFDCCALRISSHHHDPANPAYCSDCKPVEPCPACQAAVRQVAWWKHKEAHCLTNRQVAAIEHRDGCPNVEAPDA